MTVGDRIRIRRTELGMTQEELAKKLSCSKAAVSKVERLGDNITTDRMTKFAQALDVSEAYLAGWEPDNQVHRVNLVDLGILEVNSDYLETGRILAGYIEKFFSLSEGHQEQIKEVIDMFAEKDGDNVGK